MEHAVAVIFVKTLHAFTQFSMIAFFTTRTFNAFRQPIIAALRWQLLIPHHQATVVTCVTIWMNLLEFVTVIFLQVLQLCKPIRALRTCCFVASNVCEPQRMLRDRKTVRLINNLVT